jgi:hypothetical protein
VNRYPSIPTGRTGARMGQRTQASRMCTVTEMQGTDRMHHQEGRQRCNLTSHFRRTIKTHCISQPRSSATMRRDHVSSHTSGQPHLSSHTHLSSLAPALAPPAVLPLLLHTPALRLPEAPKANIPPNHFHRLDHHPPSPTRINCRLTDLKSS